MTDRSLWFAGVCAVALTVSVGYAVVNRTTKPSPVDPVRRVDPAVIADTSSRPHLLFRNTALDDTFGAVTLLPLDGLDGPRVFTPLSCERVYFAARQGICLAADRGMFTSYRSELFDAAYQTRQAVALTGIPSRARVARDGRYAALTYFVGGDSYAAAGFSTRTLIIDGAGGKVLANLEDFMVTRDGAPFKAVDFNFWGVTFAKDSNRFYATLASGDQKYLVQGDVAARTARVVRDDVECPSLSPDNRRIAFKRRIAGIVLMWRIYVLDLETGTETVAAERRSVDDQIEWFDDRTLLYAMPSDPPQQRASSDIWSVPADGSGEPRLLVTGAESPAVVRPENVAPLP